MIEWLLWQLAKWRQIFIRPEDEWNPETEDFEFRRQDRAKAKGHTNE